MTKLLGSLLIVAASIALGAKRLKLEAQHLEALGSVTHMLRHIEGELSAYQMPMPQLLKGMISHTSGSAQDFLKCLNIQLSRLGELEFSDMWKMNAYKTLKALSKDELITFVNLGNSLGRYELALQIQAINTCISRLENSLVETRYMLREKQKLYLGIPLACGALLVILLI